MYVDIFTDFLVKREDIVGIFDLDNTTTNKFTNDYLNTLRRQGKVQYLVTDIPKSFVVMKDGTVYVVELSSQILKRRCEVI